MKYQVKRILPLLLLVLLLSACGQKPLFSVSTNEDNSISVAAERGPKDSAGIAYLTVGESEQIVIDAANLNKEGKISLRFMAGILGSENFPSEAAYEVAVSGGDSAAFSADPGEYTVAVIAQSKLSGTARIYTAEVSRQPGERYEGTVILEGMEETVHYEQIRNDTIGFEMGYDYENCVRFTEADRERIISQWEDPDHPEIYLEITHSADDAEKTAAAILEALSSSYHPTRNTAALDRAGSCIEIDADADKEGLMSIRELQMVYIIPADDGCLVAWGHYTMESADGWGARFRNMMNTFKAL